MLKLGEKSGKTISIECSFSPKFANYGTLLGDESDQVYEDKGKSDQVFE